MFVGLAQASLFSFHIFSFHYFVCVCLSAYIHNICVPREDGKEEGFRSPRTGITYGCKLKYGVLRTKLGSPARAVSALSC